MHFQQPERHGISCAEFFYPRFARERLSACDRA